MEGHAPARVWALTEPLVAASGLDLVDVEVKEGPRVLVRVVVDRKGGVDLATCQELSRRLSDDLDRSDPIAGRYALEVSSPGVDRPLDDRRAFDRVEGRRVLVHRRPSDDAGAAPQQVRGTVVAAEEAVVVLRVDDVDVRIPYDQIVKATQELPW